MPTGALVFIWYVVSHESPAGAFTSFHLMATSWQETTGTTPPYFDLCLTLQPPSWKMFAEPWSRILPPSIDRCS